ncbi:cell division protein FtsW [Bacteroidia bacterium]|nr:cell division protein FtsW [Bacteroidia bacterium]
MIRKPSATVLLFLIVLFELSAFGLLSFRNEQIDYNALLVGGLCVVLFIFQYVVITRFFPSAERYILIIANLLSAIGTITLYRLNPEIAYKQVIFMAIGMVAMVVAMVAFKAVKSWQKKKLMYALMALAIALLLSSLVLGRAVNGATNWIAFGGFSVQPSEFVKIILVVVLAAWFGMERTWIQLTPIVGFVGVCMVLLLLQRDLGACVMYALAFLILLFVGTNRWKLTLASLLAFGGGAVVAYHLFDHVKVRVLVWQDPWKVYADSGFQIAQGLMAIASGGLWGMGLSLGSPRSIPEHVSDYIFAAICEEFGIIFGLAMIALYVVFIVRGALIAMNARTPFNMLVALGCTSMISVQSFVIMGGVIKLIPLTGVTLPFVSYGGSSMLSSFILVGILQSISVMNSESDQRLLKQLKTSG